MAVEQESQNVPPNDTDSDVLVTPDGEVLDNSVTGTMKIDPSRYRRFMNSNRMVSLKYALAGLLYVITREQSIQLVMALTVATVILGIWLRVPMSSWIELVIVLGMVWVTECLNTAIEAVVNIAAPEPHPMAKISKDVASTAALLSTVVFVIVVMLILGPPLVNRLRG